MSELTNWIINMNLSLNYIAIWVVVGLVALWIITELYYWAKFHIMGLLKQRKWNQFRRH